MKDRKNEMSSKDTSKESKIKEKRPYRKYSFREIFSKDMLLKLKARIPIGVVIGVSAFPAVLLILFYILRPSETAMYWVSQNISAPIRAFLAMVTSVYPFSVTELLIAFAIIWLIYYLIKTIAVVSRKRNKLKVLSKRVLLVTVLSLHIWNMFCWLWISGYHAPGFASRYDFNRDGVAIEDLVLVTRHFAERANELAPQIARDSSGSIIENRASMYSASVNIYRNISREFPSLSGRLYRPKPMIFSFLMSRTGYSGMYFALTGEANINNQIHRSILPAILAHEHAHHLGIFSEDEANFVAILACITSGNVVFAYSGYLKGLNYFIRALTEASHYALLYSQEASKEIIEIRDEILESLIFEVRLDRWENANFWHSQRTVNTGVGFVDTALTAVNNVLRDTVNNVYDRFLKAQRQELGLRSYGACVDLLVEYFITRTDIFAESNR